MKLKQFSVYFQYLLPQHLLTQLAGRLAESRRPWLKNFLIKQFIKIYHVSLKEAVIESPEDYQNFNHFFTRHLKPDMRQIDVHPNTIVSPVDGYITQMGTIHQHQLIQAKHFYFYLEPLLGGDNQLAEQFVDGKFATLYLAPHQYHRVHMPIEGELVKTIYVPGKLFSVNRMTSELVPQLYSRNERLICIFNTEIGPMALILVGAMIVGSIRTAWQVNLIRSDHIIIEDIQPGKLFRKGDEMGHFQLGSTVILLFGKDRVDWNPLLIQPTTVHMGQALGNTSPHHLPP